MEDRDLDRKLNKPFNFTDIVNYQDDSIVSRAIISKESGSVTVFAFDGGQSLSEHTVPFDALVNVVDGEAIITISSQEQKVASGESIVMPANVPHSVKAETRFKMVLSMLKK